MDTPEVWPPPPTAPPPLPPAEPTRPRFVWPFKPVVLLAVVAGIGIAWRDIFTVGPEMRDYEMIAALILALLQPRYAWLWALTLIVCMALVHCLAILFGHQPLYVERSLGDAVKYSATDLIPNLLAAYVGVIVRAIIIWTVKGVSRAKRAA